MKIYMVIPNTNVSGGIKVACAWAQLLIENGYDACIVTPGGDPSPQWLTFAVPSIGYGQVEDAPENKVVYIWLDQLDQFRMARAQTYLYMQDVAQPQYVETEPGRFSSRFLPLMQAAKLITIGPHSQYYYAYKWGLSSSYVPNFIDPEVFNWSSPKIPMSVCMIDHRDHFDNEIAQKLIDKGFILKIAAGAQLQVAQTMRECVYFFSAAKGRSDGFGHMCEGFPTPILEAMASGCIPICRNTHGTNTFIIHNVNGFYWDDLTLDTWIDLMWTWKNTPLLATACMALNTAHQAFNKKTVFPNIAKALDLQ